MTPDAPRTVIVRRALAIALSVAALVGGAALPATAATAAPLVSGSALVSSLTVATDYATGYDRDLFQHWIDADGNGCDTRQEVLMSESQIPVTKSTGCTIVAGQWYSPYDTITWTDPSDVDIDHMVPLSEAWRSGAWNWTADQRRAFANDLDYNFTLIAVTDNVNQSKGDQDPAQWMPSNSAYRCDYVAQWIQVKYRWGLNVDSAEASALNTILQEPACASTDVTLPAQIISPVTTPAPVAAPTGQLVYRFWSPQNQTHFFTISLAERNQIIVTYPANVWTYEGAAYEAYEAPGTADTVPVYRFYSTKLGGHFYTISPAERDQVEAAYDDFTWKYEGTAYYVYPTDATATGTLEVGRFWSPQNQHHFYTASAVERSQIISTYPARVWTYEGLSFKVPASLATPPPPPTQYVPYVPPVYVPPTPTIPANPGDTKNCNNFSTWAAANAWYQTYFPYYGDVAKLDQSRPPDGIPCESLPGAPR